MPIYSAEIEQDVAFLKNGGISLLEPERRLLQDVGSWCQCALQLQCSGGKDLLSIWELVGTEGNWVELRGTHRNLLHVFPQFRSVPMVGWLDGLLVG